MISSRISVVAAAVVALVVVEASAQVGAVLGRIVDEDGQGIADVKCSIELTGQGGRRTSVKTKKDGKFAKAGIRPGTYTIRCEKEGYRPLPLEVQISAFGQGDLGQQVMFELAPGELSEDEHARATNLVKELEASTEAGNDEETLEKLLELQEMMPESTEVLFNIAGTYERMGNTEKAVEYYTQSAERNPDLAYDSWLAIGDIHGKAKNWADASEAMGKAMEIKAIDPVAMFNYAVYTQNAGDAETAKVAYEKTLAIDPARAIAHYQLGLIAVNQAENEMAVQHFETFLELAPEHPQAAAAKGVIDALKAKESPQ